MSNEILFLVSALFDIAVIVIASQWGRSWLFGTIVVNLILIGIFGAKLIEVFGITTNAGNVFYACVFVATYIILEKYGRNEGLRTIWIGAGFITFFVGMSFFAVQFAGSPLSEGVNSTVKQLFSFSPRIVIASILAYIFAQYVNITIFERVKNGTAGKFLWLRINFANVASQLVDSTLFFSLAFIDLPGPILVQAILVGWLLKSAVVFLGTPFLYLDAYLTKQHI